MLLEWPVTLEVISTILRLVRYLEQLWCYGSQRRRLLIKRSAWGGLFPPGIFGSLDQVFISFVCFSSQMWCSRQNRRVEVVHVTLKTWNGRGNVLLPLKPPVCWCNVCQSCRCQNTHLIEGTNEIQKPSLFSMHHVRSWNWRRTQSATTEAGSKWKQPHWRPDGAVKVCI